VYAGGASSVNPSGSASLSADDDCGGVEGLGGRGGDEVDAWFGGEVGGGGFEVGGVFKAPVGSGVTFEERKGLRDELNIISDRKVSTR
jgi:hypothetical protein